MLLENDAFRDLDYVFSRLSRNGGATIPMPLDAYRRGEDVWVHVDLPGVSPDSVDLNVERGVLTISAQRDWKRNEGDQMYLAERSHGSYRRQVHLGEGLDAERIEADMTDGVLTLRIPVAEGREAAQDLGRVAWGDRNDDVRRRLNPSASDPLVRLRRRPLDAVRAHRAARGVNDACTSMGLNSLSPPGCTMVSGSSM